MAKSTKTATANVANETEVLRFASLKEENEYYNQPVKIKLFKDSNKYSGDVFVGVNGSEALKNSEHQDSFTIDYMAELGEIAGAAELSE